MENNQKELILLKDLGMKYPTQKSNRKYRFGLYKCFCGNEFEREIQEVKRGNTKSCGCLKITHNLWKHRMYHIWNSMIQRCTNANNKSYKYYGERGISVCNEWIDINKFIEDMYPTFKEGLTLDRENNDLGYSKDNCRWATKFTQQRNKRLLQRNNTSCYKGVSWNNARKIFISMICVNNKSIYLGRFNNALESAKAYDDYIIKHKLEHTRNFS